MPNIRMLMMIILGLVFIFIAILGIGKTIRATSIAWKTTIGNVISFDSVPWAGSGKVYDDRNGFEVKILYSYIVDDKTYQSSNTRFDGDPMVKSLQQIGRFFGANNNPPTQVTVFYNIHNPEQAVLVKPNLLAQWGIILFSLLLATVFFILSFRVR